MKAYLEIEMPKSCYYCSMTNDGFYLCKATSPFKELEDDCEECKPQWCPLVPIPEHGDLIDRDALMKILSKVIDINASIEQRNEATDQERRCLWWFEQQIGIAPTIIPAEEGE